MALRKRRQTQATARPDPAGEVPERQAAYIDEGAELVGRLHFKDAVRIDGNVDGEIRAAKDVIVGENASIEASIDADSVVVYGTVEGDIRVNRKITLHKSARVTGEIQTAGIVVEEGARFRGCILIGDDDPAPDPVPNPAPEASPAAASKS